MSRSRLRHATVTLAALATLATVAACGGDPTASDLPSGVYDARPTITTEEADFVIAAGKLGVTVTGESVDDDIETGTTTCWAIDSGGATLAQVAVDDTGRPLGDEGDALRTKRLMAAGVQTFCPDHDDQIPSLELP
jgi:ABC-type glycerol-3-phosphate transport system substrate-binding protein